jgi:DNA-binding XRE family transcriptional regulator
MKHSLAVVPKPGSAAADRINELASALLKECIENQSATEFHESISLQPRIHVNGLLYTKYGTFSTISARPSRPMMIYVEQIRGARALLGWSQIQLAEASGVGLMTIKRLESGAGPVKASSSSVWAVEQALDNAGIVLIPEDDSLGPGVRLKSTPSG